MFDMLTHVKTCLGITGDYHDAILRGYIEDIEGYLVSAGVPESVAGSRKCGGVVARGVADLWNYGSGGAEMSAYFHERAAQIVLTYAAKKDGDDE